MRIPQMIVLSGLAVTTFAVAEDINDFASAVPKWSDSKMSGVAQLIESSIEGDAFTVCYQQSTGTNYLLAVNNSVTGQLEDVAALSAMEIYGLAYSSSMDRLAVSFLDLQGNPKTILFGTDGLPMRTFYGTSMVAFDGAGVAMAVAGEGSPYIEVAALATGESIRVFICDEPMSSPNAIAIATEDNGASGVVGAVGTKGSITAWDLPTGNQIFTHFTDGDGENVSIDFAPGCTYVGGGGEGDNTFASDRGTLSIFALPGSGDIVGQRVFYTEIDQDRADKLQFTNVEEQLLVSGRIDDDIAVTAYDWREDISTPVQIMSDQSGDEVINDFAFAAEEMVWATVGTMGVTAYVPGTPVQCPEDIDGNAVVDGGDLAALLGEWQGTNPALDLDGNGIVDGGDLSRLLAAWGNCTD
ncbi:MAG: hypothetical protein P8J45_03390 [Phycisphaerales bacterium]|nr:hypothetical protein [Phycisphaerales bacterium]